MIEQLSTPVTKDTGFSNVVLTHRGWGFTYQPWDSETQIRSYSVLGVLKPDGSFKPFPGTEEYAQIPAEAPEFAALVAANALGKKPNVFRNTDVQLAHETYVARLQAEAAARASAPA